MNLFDIEDGKIVANATSLAIPEFKKLWTRDKSKEKDQAYKDLSYVVFMCDMSMNNPYRNYAEDDREKVLKKDFFNSETIELDKDIQNAINKFKQMQETVSVRLLRSAKKAAEKLSQYFDKIDFNEKDSYGRLIYSARDVSSNLKEIGNIVKSLSTLEDQVKKEQASANKIRGGGEIGEYEIIDNNFDYGDKVE
ncbi:MAG: hypothetical protein ACOCUI_00405 [bacterium]